MKLISALLFVAAMAVVSAGKPEDADARSPPPFDDKEDLGDPPRLKGNGSPALPPRANPNARSVAKVALSDSASVEFISVEDVIIVESVVMEEEEDLMEMLSEVEEEADGDIGKYYTLLSGETDVPSELKTVVPQKPSRGRGKDDFPMEGNDFGGGGRYLQTTFADFFAAFLCRGQGLFTQSCVCENNRSGDLSRVVFAPRAEIHAHNFAGNGMRVSSYRWVGSWQRLHWKDIWSGQMVSQKVWNSGGQSEFFWQRTTWANDDTYIISQFGASMDPNSINCPNRVGF